MLKYKENFEQTKEYFRAFWKKEVIDRPLIAVTCPKDPANPVWPAPYMAGSADGKYLEALQRQEEYFAGMDYSAGEAIPTFECSFGPDQFAAFLGAKLEIKAGTSWVHPCLESFEGFHAQLGRSENSVYTRLLQFISVAADYAKGKFLINTPDLHSNMDALSAMRSPEELCVDLMLDEENVLSALEQVRKLYPVVIEDVIRAGKFEQTGMIGWAPTYCEGKFATVQCDFSCMIGPAMARKFVIPAIREEAAYLDHCVYHYDGKEALGHLDDVLAIKEIDVIQWVPGDGNPRSIQWMDLLHKIQAAGKGLWIYDWTVDEIKEHFKELKPEGLIFQVSAKDRKEAEGLVSYVKKHM